MKNWILRNILARPIRWWYKTFYPKKIIQLTFRECYFQYGDVIFDAYGYRSKCIGKNWFIQLPNKYGPPNPLFDNITNPQTNETRSVTFSQFPENMFLVGDRIRHINAHHLTGVVIGTRGNVVDLRTTCKDPWVMEFNHNLEIDPEAQAKAEPIMRDPEFYMKSESKNLDALGNVIEYPDPKLPMEVLLDTPKEPWIGLSKGMTHPDDKPATEKVPCSHKEFEEIMGYPFGANAEDVAKPYTEYPMITKLAAIADEYWNNARYSVYGEPTLYVTLEERDQLVDQLNAFNERSYRKLDPNDMLDQIEQKVRDKYPRFFFNKDTISKVNYCGAVINIKLLEPSGV